MRVLIDAPRGEVPPTVVEGWWNALGSCGWDVGVLVDHEHVFDVFHDYGPDLLLAAVPPCRPVLKCRAERPRLRVVPIDPRPAFDRVKFKPGIAQPAFACDLAFVAEWTPEKEPLYREFLDPVVECGRFDVKLFGAGRVCPYGQHLGRLDDAFLPDLYASARFCLDLTSGEDTERGYQIAGLRGIGVSNISSISHHLVDGPEGLIDLLSEQGPRISAGWPHLDVLANETYFHRLASAFGAAGVRRKAARLLKAARPEEADA